MKISALVRGVERPHAYPNVYAGEQIAGGARLRVGLRGGHAAALLALAAVLAPPYKVLYVLHTTRIGAVLGRHESDLLDGPDVQAALDRFGAFLAGDARHDVWLQSAGDGTVVLDRFNMMYAYGPLDAFAAVLERGGVRRGALPEVPYPHALHYHEMWDGAERDAVAAFGWRITPLRPEDVQFDDPQRAS